MANYVVLPEGEEEYGCPECGEQFDSRGEASRCCTSPHEGWKCNVCGEVYEDSVGAATCCPDITEGWVCRDCSAIYEDEDQAQRCCAHDPDDIDGGRYKCVVDGVTWETAEQAANCCRIQESPSEAVESIEMHATDCRCYDCQRAASETPEAIMAAALSAPAKPKDDDWTKALMG